MIYYDGAIVSFTVLIQKGLFIVITHCQLHYRDHFPSKSKSSPNWSSSQWGVSCIVSKILLGQSVPIHSRIQNFSQFTL